MSGPNYTSILWDRDDDPRGNVQHIARHGLTRDEVEDAFQNPTGRGISRSSGRPILFGNTRTGRHVMVVYTLVAASTIRPITAYEVPRRK